MSTTSKSFKITLTLIFLIATNFNTNAQGISKVSEIYDYEIGDVFHTVFWLSVGMNGFSTRFNVEIIDKYYSQTNDTLYYVRDVARLHIDILGTTTSYYIDTIYYTNLDSEIFSGNIDSVYSDPDLFNGRLINYYDCHGCYNCAYVEKRWVVGCGGSYDYYIYTDLNEGGFDLLYFLKGDEEWGEPYYVSIADINKKIQNLKVFPNPANDFIIIDPGVLINGPTRTTILTTLGNVVQIFDTENSLPVHIDISNFQAGIYFIKIEANNNSLIGKFIKY